MTEIKMNSNMSDFANIRKAMRLVMLCFGFALTGCAKSGFGEFGLGPLTRLATPTLSVDKIGDEQGDAKFNYTPGPGVTLKDGIGTGQGDRPKLQGEVKQISVDQLPVPAFLEAVLGKTLGLTYQVDPQVAQRQDIVSLRTAQARTPEQLLSITEEVLKPYGIRLKYAGDVVRVVPDQSVTSETPLVLRGRNGQDVPKELRSVFQSITLGSVSLQEMQAWIVTAFGKRVQSSVSATGTLLLYGLSDDVRSVVDAIRVLDQPKLAGKQSAKVEPVYWSVEPLAKKLTEILTTEGYSAAFKSDVSSSIVFLPIETVNILLIFCSDPATINHAVEWARDLDRPAKADPLKRTFVYQVANTSASLLGDTVSGVLGGPTAPGTGNSAGTSAVPSLSQSGLNSSLPGQSLSGTGTASTPGGGSSDSGRTITTQSGGRMVIDPQSNSIIFVGSAEEYGRVLPVIKALDRAPREAMIEVTVAEITLDQNENLGVEWALKMGLGGGYTGYTGTLGNLGTPGSTATKSSGQGLDFAVLNSAGAVRAVVNAFAKDNRVKFLLTPRLLTRSGSEATIKVGTDVPVLTSQSTSPLSTGGTTGILNQVSYRSTGTTLKVKPTVYNRDRIDLEMSQEVSEAQTNNVSDVQSPLIFSRSVNTKVPLNDGATVMIGGLISETKSGTVTGVPFLQDLPFLGNAFRNDSFEKKRTELFIFITPYVIDTPGAADAITEQFRDRLDHWEPVASPFTKIFK
jgi:general secretion pathway protein D